MDSEQKFKEIIIFWIHDQRMRDYRRMYRDQHGISPPQNRIDMFNAQLIASASDIRTEADGLYTEFLEYAQSKKKPKWEHILFQGSYSVASITIFILYVVILYELNIPEYFTHGSWQQLSTLITAAILAIVTALYSVIKIYNEKK